MFASEKPRSARPAVKPLGAIHWGRRVVREDLSRQEAWYDVTVYSVPFSGTFDRDRMWRAVNDKIRATGIGGNFIYGGRGYTFTGLDPNNANCILIEHLFAIGD